jgi:hypothetical protein
MKAKPWQIVVIALAFVAVGASAAYMLTSSGPDIPSRITLVDVTTGQLYEVNLKKYRVVLPARDPEQKQMRLFPVKKSGAGWVLTDTGMGMIRGTDLDTKAVNLSTGEVTNASADVRQYVPPGAT